jgi:hypothetical protein
LYAVICERAPLRDENGELPVADRLTAELLAILLVRLGRAGVYLDEQGEFTRGGKVKPVAEYERRLANVARDYLESLGLTPRGRGKLGVDLARVQSFDLARHWQEETE